MTEPRQNASVGPVDNNGAKVKGVTWSKIGAILIGGGIIAAFIGVLPDMIAGLRNERPTLSFQIDPLTGEAPLAVTANVDTADPDGDEVKIEWILNGNQLTKGNLDSYTFDFDQPGSYEIIIKASDGREVATKRQAVIVTPPVKRLTSLSLDSPLEIHDPGADYEIAGEIITNGYPLTLNVNGILGGTAQIRSFPPGRPTSGSNGGNGGNGRSGNNGSGQNGADGQPGGHGASGVNGKSAGNITIRANRIDANLIISNKGQPGANGGNGGNGGRGGNGGQGSPSSAGFSIGGVGDCRSGPGRGGKGGNGGPGGNGGNAGNGGNGGNVYIEVEEISSTISIQTDGGGAGLPGSEGRGGSEGTGGPEGALNGPCGSAGRVGANGTIGNEGNPGTTGNDGDYGTIEVLVNGILKNGNQGRFIHQP